MNLFPCSNDSYVKKNLETLGKSFYISTGQHLILPVVFKHRWKLAILLAEFFITHDVAIQKNTHSFKQHETVIISSLFLTISPFWVSFFFFPLKLEKQDNLSRMPSQAVRLTVPLAKLARDSMVVKDKTGATSRKQSYQCCKLPLADIRLTLERDEIWIVLPLHNHSSEYLNLSHNTKRSWIYCASSNTFAWTESYHSGKQMVTNGFKSPWFQGAFHSV